MSIEVEYSEPIPSRLMKPKVFAFAENVANQVGYKPGQDVSEIVEKLGGKVKIRDYWESSNRTSESTVVNAPNDFIIYLPPDTSLERDNFTIAHELGHYVLHYLLARHRGRDIQKMIANRYGSERTEWEANWFAAGFLMPSDEFRKKYRESGGNIHEVAKHFCVSTSAADIRAKSIGLK